MLRKLVFAVVGLVLSSAAPVLADSTITADAVGVTELDFISGTASPVATPEPAPLVLLGVAMCVLAPLICRRSDHVYHHQGAENSARPLYW